MPPSIIANLLLIYYHRSQTHSMLLLLKVSRVSNHRAQLLQAQQPLSTSRLHPSIFLLPVQLVARVALPPIFLRLLEVLSEVSLVLAL